MFLSAFRASTGDRSPWGDFFFSPIGSLTGSGARVDADSAMALSSVFACTRVLAESFAVLPFRLYRPRASGGRERVTDHWLHRLFCRQPNRWQTPFEWREMMQGHLALRGNGFNRIIEDGAGGVAELLPLHPDRIRVELVDEYAFRYRYSRRDGTQELLRPDQVWHLRGLGGDGYVGYNPIEIARESIGEALQYQSFSARFFANNATPPFWIKVPGKFADKTARQSFREQVQEAQTGINRGKVMALDQGMELNQIGINQKDMQFLELRGAKVPEIARIFRVPLHMIGDLSKATFSNIEQQSIEFWTGTMHPWCERWESSIESALLGPDTDLEVEFEMRSQLRGDSAARAKYVQGLIQSAVLTPNEGREMEGLDPVDGGDERLIPVNMRLESEPLQPAGAGQADPEDDQTPGAPKPADARLVAVLTDNADRMARRIAAGDAPSAVVLSAALAIDEEHARQILGAAWINEPRHVLATHLLGQALKGQP